MHRSARLLMRAVRWKNRGRSSLQVVEAKMKSLHKIPSPSSDTQPVIWNVADLDIKLNVIPVDDQREQILALFGTGQNDVSNERENECRSALHPQGIDLLLASWQPADLSLQSDLHEIPQW